MLESKILTPKETEDYLRELRSWIEASRSEPVEEMSAFFAERIDIYEGVHLGRLGREYAHFADYLRDGLTSLLDIGCGTGLELESVYRRFPDVSVTGVDLSEVMLGELRKKYSDRNIKLIQADYTACPLGEAQYDAAMSFETLHHLQYEDKRRVYRKLWRAIRDGGYYIECDYYACCAQEETLCLENYVRRRAESGIPEGTFVHIDIPLTLEHQRELLCAAGFRRVEVLYQNCGTFLVRADK